MNTIDCLYLDDLADEIFYPPVQTSFLPYSKPKPLCFEASSKGPNIHMKMIQILRQIPVQNKANDKHQEFEKDRSYRHMINERLRRGKQKNTLSALHSLLPPGTKNDKYSILQMATLHLQELKGLKENLQNRNRALENNAGRRPETDTFRLRRQTPPSGIDSMIGVMKCLKKMGLKARTIQSEFTPKEFFAVMEIDQKIEAVEVEKAVESALEEVEMKSVLDITSTEWYLDY
ncbi:hypothetical protein ACHQM5_014502 [Ranunculus cassubicifolius]